MQSSLYSTYKQHVAYDALIGIAPSGAITFAGLLFDSSISDKEIVQRSGIFIESLWNEGDSVMAERDFTIAEGLKLLNVSLSIPAFLNGRDRLTGKEALESQTVASVRIHVERAIQPVKKFKQIKNEIPLVLHRPANYFKTAGILNSSCQVS